MIVVADDGICDSICLIDKTSSLNTTNKQPTIIACTRESSSFDTDVDNQPIVLNVQLKSHYASICNNCSYYPIKASNYLLKHALTDNLHKTSYSSGTAWSKDVLKLQVDIAYVFPFICHVCSFYATQFTGFVWHMTSANHREKAALAKTICQKCGAYLKTMANILEHYRREVNLLRDKFYHGTLLCCTYEKSRTLSLNCNDHANMQYFKCRLCHHKFRTNFQVNRHLETVHMTATRRQDHKTRVKHHSSLMSKVARPSKMKRKRTLDSSQNHLSHSANASSHQKSCLPMKSGIASDTLNINETRSNTDSGNDDRETRIINLVAASEKESDVTQKQRKQHFKCEINGCKRSFGRKCQLVIHMSAHYCDKPYKCDKCGYATKYKTKLNEHQKTHNDEQPFRCDQCSYRAKRRIELLTHIRLHTGSKPYKCPYCDYTATTNGNLRKHILKSNKHNGAALYPCNHCDFKTNLFAAYQNHLRDMHSNLYTELAIAKMNQKSVFESILNK